MNNNKKLWSLKIRGVQKEKKRKKKTHLVGWKAYFSCYFFHYSLFCTSKMISKAWGNALVTFFITQNETNMMKI
jgi:hypothetical protein